MADMVSTFVTDLIGRIDGPMSFRVYIQPLVAIAFAIRDGRGDALAGRAPYGWALFTDPEHRRVLLRDGWKSVWKVFAVAWSLDLVYQFAVVREFHAFESLATAILLALVPYVLLRGPAARLMHKPGAKRGTA